MQKQILRKNLTNILFITIFFSILIFSLGVAIFFPRDINYYENRYNKKMILPTAQTISDTSFQDTTEDALADQIPKAQPLKKLYNTYTSNFVGSILKPIFEKNIDQYIRYKDTLFFGDQIVYSAYNLEETKSDLDRKAENYNYIFEKYNQIDYYAYYIEKDTDINFETNEKIDADEYIFAQLNLPDNQKAVFEINHYSDFQKYFYKTDHHWNYAGSYKAYQELLVLLNCKDTPISAGKKVTVSKDFMGSKSSSAGFSFIKEPFYAYEFTTPKMTITMNGKKVSDYGEQQEFISGSTSSTITYGNFYGIDAGEIIFDTGDTSKENILVIGESYDNAVLKLLASHFHITHSIDLRNYEHFLGEKFNYEQYLKEHSIDKVLLIGNIDFYIKKEFNLENN